MQDYANLGLYMEYQSVDDLIDCLKIYCNLFFKIIKVYK